MSILAKRAEAESGAPKERKAELEHAEQQQGWSVAMRGGVA